MSKDGMFHKIGSTIHLVYQRQYYDEEDQDFFFINYTIFRNVPLSQLNRLNNKEFKQKGIELRKLGIHIGKFIYIKHMHVIQPSHEKENEVGDLWN